MEPDRSRLEFLILADRAEVLGGKLYLMGGCWDQIALPDFPAGYQVGVALRAHIAEAAGDEHTITFQVTGPGEPTILPRSIRFSRQVVADRAPGPVLVALTTIMMFPAEGDYTLVAAIDDGEPLSARFRVNTAPTP